MNDFDGHRPHSVERTGAIGARSRVLDQQAWRCTSLARELAVVAGSLHGVVDGATALHTPATWDSAAATISRFGLRARRGVLDRARRDVAAVIAALDGRADQLHRHAAALRSHHDHRVGPR